MLFYTIENSFLKWLGEFEGYSATPYACPAIKLTIGYGHCILPDEKINGFSGKLMLESFEILKKRHKYLSEINLALGDMFSNFLSKEQALELLEKDVLKTFHKINMLVKSKLNSSQSKAILSLVFNIGITAFRKSTLLKYINIGDFYRASQEFERWVYVGRKFTQGLAIRRRKEKEMFETRA